MTSLKLKKLFQKAGLDSVLKSVAEILNISANVYDERGQLIWQGTKEKLDYHYDIKVEEEIIGSVKGDKKTEAIVKILNYLIQQEISKKRLAEEVLAKYEEINFFYDLADKIASSLEIEDILSFFVAQVREFIEATEIFIILLDKETGKLEELTPDTGKVSEIKVSQWKIVNHVFETQQAEIINDVTSDLRYTPTNSQVKSLICAPLTVQNETIGVIKISHIEQKNYTTEDLKLLMTLNSQVAGVIKVAQTYEQLRQYSEQLEEKVAQRTIALEKLNKELQRLATEDDLTQLANRRYFNRYLDYEWRQMSLKQKPMALILGDVDYFKQYNDNYGHQAGDYCLQQVARAITNVVRRPGCLVARYGGEEFAIVLTNTNYIKATVIIEKIRQAVENMKMPHQFSEVSKYVTISLGGVRKIPSDSLSYESLIKSADEALYEAKAQGRNCFCFKT